MDRHQAAEEVRSWGVNAIIQNLPVEATIKAVTDIFVGWLRGYPLSDDQRKALLYFSDELEKVVTAK